MNQTKVLLRRAAELIEEHAKQRWDSCVDSRGRGFVCTDISCGDAGSGLCRREWKEMVSTAKGLRVLLRARKQCGDSSR